MLLFFLLILLILMISFCLNSLLYSYIFENVHLTDFMHLVLKALPDGVTVGDSGLLSCPLSVERYYFHFFVDSVLYKEAVTSK